MLPKFSKYIDLAQCLIDKPESDYKHFSFIIQKNRIRAIGWNSLRTHPLAFKMGYKYSFVHSELSAITRFEGPPKELKNCTMVNVRLGKEGNILYSRPCKHCLKLLNAFNMRNVFYTTKQGCFEELK